MVTGDRPDVDESRRTTTRGTSGSTTFVYPKDVMAEMRASFTTELERRLPALRVLYST